MANNVTYDCYKNGELLHSDKTIKELSELLKMSRSSVYKMITEVFDSTQYKFIEVLGAESSEKKHTAKEKRIMEEWDKFRFILNPNAARNEVV